jgi:hypothetical protein
MNTNIIVTEGEWHYGLHFIYLTIERSPDGQEFDELCSNYFEKHKAITLPGEALLIDLRPAFESSLNDVVPKSFCSVPVGYTLPDP